VVESVVLLAASRGNASHILHEAGEFYRMDVAAITAQVKQELAAKEKRKLRRELSPKRQQSTYKGCEKSGSVKTQLSKRYCADGIHRSSRKGHTHECGFIA